MSAPYSIAAYLEASERAPWRLRDVARLVAVAICLAPVLLFELCLGGFRRGD